MENNLNENGIAKKDINKAYNIKERSLIMKSESNSCENYNKKDLDAILKNIQQLERNINKKFDEQQKQIMRTTPQPQLQYMILNILDHCNLNCQSCDHFAPLAEKKFVAVDVLENDLKNMSKLLDKSLVRMSLMGGEPLLHPDLLKIIPLARQYFPDTRIQIVTNGLFLLKQPDEFWSSCNKYSIEIVNTKYPINQKYDKMQEKAIETGVLFKFYGGGSVVKTSYKEPLDLEGSQNPIQSFMNCSYLANYATFVMEGKVYSCPTVPNIKHFNKTFDKNLMVTNDDYLVIEEIENKEQLFKFMCTPRPFCRYCMTNKKVNGIPWARTKRVIDEWTIVEGD